LETVLETPALRTSRATTQVGIALLLTGIGFGVLAAGLLGQRPRTASEAGVQPVAKPVAIA
jgi:hypothetical protein